MKANGLDLTLFQFDYDLTFSVFFMNADKTIYGRYGSRSSVEEATRDMSIRGLAEAMSAVLRIHEGYPKNRQSLFGKQAVIGKYKTANDIPSLRGKYSAKLNYPGAVTKSCMHCHQIRDAKRQVFRDSGEPLPDKLMFPNPLPDVIGLSFDPRRRATISGVKKDSIAETAGLQAGDELLTLEDQPIISLADIQWILHNAKDNDTLSAVVQRKQEKRELSIALANGWREQSDISWRVSSWPLRRMVTGGLLFEPATEEARRKAHIGDDKLALVVKHVGQYGAHAAAKRAGFKKGDIVISYNGREENMTPSQLLAYGARNTNPGQKVPVVVIRNGNQKKLALPMQK